ncbi:MAG: PorP/SprF family type IX secretion system membrane protein [Candidatus Pedobacter colombiensis]|uniref:PorP/SprF family type IX secretion system membrane protein n=1 Tax=Candidatus Pedobacter colombiensis TaxID=3121371 RepID=A0AAJ5W7V0_9SPHI|nr:PorP/SprF family type IX secretion system membrane protein [Pedobacter sp.]WEK19642.1 MAG: PorP/SprF family type IX secretion system membrane protein [Pedobacter sp.]
MKTIYKTALLLAFSATIGSVKAQLNPLSAQYFTNQYLINPAFAGAGQGLKLNGAYRKLWSNVPGSPLTQNLTADYGFNKVGLGLSVNNESAGLQRQTRVVGTYAYHLPLNSEGQQLHFGVSLGFMTQRLENADIYGNPNDPSVGQYNDRKTYLDGDFGVAYTSGKLNVQAAIPNLKSVLKKDVIQLADVATFYTAASYQINISEGAEGMDLEPKVAYRGVKGFDNIWDAGTQLSIANKQVMLLAMYHSTKNTTFGLGMDYKKKYLISGTYTTQTSALSSYTNGSFELNLRLNLSK